MQKCVSTIEHNQGLCQMLLGASYDHCAQCLTPDCAIVPEATHEASRGPLKGALSAQKPVKCLRRRQGSCLEERKRIKFSRWWGPLICPPGKSMIKKETEKNWVSSQTCWAVLRVLLLVGQLRQLLIYLAWHVSESCISKRKAKHHQSYRDQVWSLAQFTSGSVLLFLVLFGGAAFLKILSIEAKWNLKDCATCEKEYW